MGILLEVDLEEGDEEPVGKSEAWKVGARLGPALGILLGLEVGPAEEGLEEAVGKSETTKVGARLRLTLGKLLGSRSAQKKATKSP
jgi:hypothetical protein